MRNLILLLLLLPISQASENCGDVDKMFISSVCIPKLIELSQVVHKSEMQRFPVPLLKEMNAMCQDLLECFDSFPCLQAQQAIATFRKPCFGFELHAVGIIECMSSFFQDVYEKKKCTLEHDYFSKDPIEKRKAYTLGKRCFLDSLQPNCSSFYELLQDSEKYEMFVNEVTTPPEDCTGLYSDLEVRQCLPVFNDFAAKNANFYRNSSLSKDISITEMIETCRGTESCLKNSCSAGDTYLKFGPACATYELINETCGAFADKKGCAEMIMKKVIDKKAAAGLGEEDNEMMNRFNFGIA